MGKIVGIDLGTTNSVVASMNGGTPEIIVNSEGHRLTPSVVAYLPNGEILVGEPAKRQISVNPDNTIISSKRFMGRRFAEVAEECSRVNYNVVEGPNGYARFEIFDALVSPEEVAALILKKLIHDASTALGETVTEAVITVPAYFNDAQRQATKQAGEIAGIDVLRILNEPTAASLAYGLNRRSVSNVLVFDLGGGTFDVSLIDVTDDLCEVRATSGDTHLGGDDFDSLLGDWAMSRIDRKLAEKIIENPGTVYRVREAVEQAKCALSTVEEYSIDLPFLVHDESAPQHFQVKITRPQLEAAIAPLIDRCKEPIQRALQNAGIAASELSSVILVGGSTRIPKVREAVKELTGGLEPQHSVNPDEAVALGAAVQAGILRGDVNDLLLLDVTPFSLGILLDGDEMSVVIEQNTAIPVRESRLYSTATNFQRGADMVILEGESSRASQNRILGKFALEGLPSKIKGESHVEVVFDINENGILTVSAQDVQSGRMAKIVIDGAMSLSDKDVKEKSRSLKKNWRPL